MNIMKIFSLGMTFYSLNKGQTAHGKQIVKEAMDVVQSLGNALKDQKITMAEKKALVTELREFSKGAIETLDSITIPTPRKTKK